MKSVKVKAHANIALIKYWGKKDEKLFLPFNSSLSLTLDAFYTITDVKVIDGKSDVFYLDGKIQDEEETSKISKFIDRFRKLSNKDFCVRIDSKNHFPTAAGLASSASGFAALAGALNEIYETRLDKKHLSIMARKGSGSATRSLFGGFVEWKKGHDDLSSFAEKFDDANWDIGMIIVILNDKKKKVLSRAGMKQTVETCPFYPAWVEDAKKDLEDIKVAIKEQDLDKVGEIAEYSAMKMHATMMATRPSIIYMQPKSLEVINMVKELRHQGLSCYVTMDAGPNVKIITSSRFKDEIIDKLKNIIDKDKIIYSKVGTDLEILERVI
ncbi:MAG: diphosphomevalonate decarboxylase [Tissierellia bacterium]|nr:diphosphomevalonate decarboxylase [Tissierellia bacterium]